MRAAPCSRGAATHARPASLQPERQRHRRRDQRIDVAR
jgi:hypothetical protein